MPNWSQLVHANGTADNLPALLAALEKEPTDNRWIELGQILCHNGVVYSASFATLPWLAAMAGRGTDLRTTVSAVVLAGSVVAEEDQHYHGVSDVRGTYKTQITSLLDAANACLPEITEQSRYASVLQAVTAFEGVPVWRTELAWGLQRGDYWIECPDCDQEVFIFVRAQGAYSSSTDPALDPRTKKRPLNPVLDPTRMTGIGQRLYETAVAHEQYEVAVALRYLFGEAPCVECGAVFRVGDRVKVL